jgi:hypothetical protein
MLKVSVALDEQQQVQLQLILIDENAEVVLRYLKEVIWAQVQTTHRKDICNHLEMGD